MQGWWFEQHVERPLGWLLDVLAVGGQTVDADACDALANGIEGLFRSEAPVQYAPWPRETTTDGTTVCLVSRTSTDSIDAIGTTCIDFDGRVFPSRLVVEVRRGATAATGFIGQVDADTGEPPRLPRGTIINTPFVGETEHREATVILGHREIRPEWTQAFEVSWAGY